MNNISTNHGRDDGIKAEEPKITVLRDLMGKKIQLIQKPDGCTSGLYPVIVGEYYEVIGTGGCVLEVLLPASNGDAVPTMDSTSRGNIGLINYTRFDISHPIEILVESL